MEKLTFEVDGVNGPDVHQAFGVLAEQTMRPKIVAGTVLGHHLEWQFYCEELDLVLLRHDLRKFVAIDNPSRVFRAREQDAPRFQ